MYTDLLDLSFNHWEVPPYFGKLHLTILGSLGTKTLDLDPTCRIKERVGSWEVWHVCHLRQRWDRLFLVKERYRNYNDLFLGPKGTMAGGVLVSLVRGKKWMNVESHQDPCSIDDSWKEV